MKREFSKLGTEASIKNTLPIDETNPNTNKQAVVPYRSRSGQIEILPQEEYDFEVSSSGKAIYYMKQETENLKAVNLYEDKEPEPPTPTGDNVYEKDTEGSIVDFDLRDAQTEEIIPVGSELEIGHYYWIMPLVRDMYDFYASNVYVGQDENVTFCLTEEMVIDNKVIIKVVNA